jgi:hypothetical protein
MNYLLKVIKLKSIIREKPFRLANLAPVPADSRTI